MNSENSKTSEHNVLVLKLTDKLDLRRGQKPLLYQILVFIIPGKMQRVHNNINLEYLLQHGVKTLSYQMDIFSIRYSRLFCLYFKET